jgi:4-amino-4-deoxy-L-arabinose transferase-like glycosyltransferase
MNKQLLSPTSASKSYPCNLDCVVIFVLGILLRLPVLPTTGDDAFITFRYVRNLIAGQGYVFNPGEHVLGTTTPFYTLYLALIGNLGLDFILVGKLTNIVADTATILLLFSVVFHATNRIVAWVVALLVLSSPYNLQFSANGMETGIYTFMIPFVLYLYEQRQWKSMALAGGILVLVRPDGVLALLVIALFWLLDRQGLRAGIKFALLAALVTLPWFIFATWYFGSPIPHSITAKALTYRSSVPMEWLYILWYIFAQNGGLGGGLLIVALLGTGSMAVLSRQTLRPLRLYLVWMVLYIATFTLFQSGRFGWYYAPIMPILFTLVVLGGAEWFEQTRRFTAMTRIMQSNLRYALLATLFLAIIVISGISVYGSWQEAWKEVAYEKLIWQPLGLWIRENSDPNATVAVESIGGVGWYSERYIWDEGGLVSTKTYTLNQETPGNINVLAILQTYRPDFFIVWKSWELETLNTPEAQAWFKANYAFVNNYTTHEISWTLFQLRSSEKVHN